MRAVLPENHALARACQRPAPQLVYSIGIIAYILAMLSQKSRYALRALLVLATRGDTQPMQISDIADSAKVPRKFLEQMT